MANVPETADSYTAGIYQLETDDPVQGGPNGIDNRQATQLGNRTRYLKDHVDDIESGDAIQDAAITALGASVTLIEAAAGGDPGPATRDYWWRG